MVNWTQAIKTGNWEVKWNEVLRKKSQDTAGIWTQDLVQLSCCPDGSGVPIILHALPGLQ